MNERLVMSASSSSLIKSDLQKDSSFKGHKKVFFFSLEIVDTQRECQKKISLGN
jgi:hypothetical protein